ncbi:trigger factor [Desulfatirhabdium butyrativorans]|uniref:trigger factor n=1 Tax=Desulfatirhabdium butyrativorans TaxID=340467 RepID=UPI000402A88E|nr:trigger factor [Desulfatirhabdium butyrativorans]
MNYSIESASEIRKTVSFEFPEDEIRQKIDTYYRELNQKISVKGFRPGKVPRAVLERKFQKEAQKDVALDLMDNAIQEMMAKEKDIVHILPISALDLSSDPPYRFQTEIEVKPNLADIPFRGIAVTRKCHTPSDQEVETHLKLHQKNLTRYEKIAETRPLKDGDMAILQYKATENGQTVAAENDFRYTMGNHFFTADFDQAIDGMQVDETRTVTVSFPEGHRMEVFAGKTLVFEVRLVEIRAPILPAIDDELAKQLGDFQNLEELKQAIRERLDAGYRKRAEQKLHEDIFAEIDTMIHFEVPQKLIDIENDIIVEDYKRAIQYHGGKPENLDEAALKERYRPLAEKQARRHLILEKVARQEGVLVEEADLKEFYRNMAEGIGQDANVIEQYYNANGAMMDSLRETLLEKKAMRLIVDSCNITEVPAEAETGENIEEEIVE